MTTALERQEAPPVTEATGGSARTINLDRLAEATEARYADRMARHNADPNLDPRLLAAYGSREIWRIDDGMKFLGLSVNSRTKITKIAGPDRLPAAVAGDGTIDVGVLFHAGKMPTVDFVLNDNPTDADIITVKRIIPAWFEGTFIEWAIKDHRMLFNTATGLFVPHRFRIGRPPGSKNRTTD